MEKGQELEWLEAQKIAISKDLVATAKQQLKFLAAVDRNRWLYDGPAMQRAIYRYNACWLPLLAKNSESKVSEGPLVIPLDCEWVWHCHRLNPVRYKSDCERLYGSILDNRNVVSSIQGVTERETKQIWNKLYPDEPYDFDLKGAFVDNTSGEVLGAERFTNYDLVSAIERQIPFFYQVSRSHMQNELFLEGAVARYRGFLHLIRRNKERSIKRFCVPTYDIDLIWHSHQLHPVSYCKDLVEVLDKVLEHDDTDSDRTKGKKLDVGFAQTSRQWEETFGSRYWRAGAMYRGSAPSPLKATPCTSNIAAKKAIVADGCQKIIHLPETKVVEVMLEFVEIRNLPEGQKGSIYVLFSKREPDTIFNAKRRLGILSESGEKQVALFHCQPTGHLHFDLVSLSLSSLPISRPSKTIGSTSISLGEYLDPISNLSMEKWLELVPSSGTVNPKPIQLRVAVSFTIPIPAPHVLHITRSRPFLKGSCFFPLPGMVQSAKSWTRITDEAGSEVISLQMRDFKKAKGIDNQLLNKEVIGILKSGEMRILAELVGSNWSLIDSQWSLQLQKDINEDGHLFQLTGHRMVKIFPGRKLEYEPKHCDKQRNEHDFMTAIEFSAEDPYGRAVALLDLKSGIIKAQEEWLVLPAITLAFIISEIMRKEGYNGLISRGENLKGGDLLLQKVNGFHEEGNNANLITPVEKEGEMNLEVSKGNIVVPEKGDIGIVESNVEFGSVIKSGGCGSGCGGGCGNNVKSSACGSGCGGGCGNMLKSGGCGSGCGGGCGSGCGGGCGNMAKSGGCGSGCGNMAKSGGCGSGCGGGCRNQVK